MTKKNLNFKRVFVFLIACIYTGGVFYVLTSSDTAGMSLSWLSFSHADKLVHLLIFFFLVIIWMFSFRKLKILPIVCLSSLGFSLLTELLQLYTPGRTFDIKDIAANISGIIFAGLLYGIFRKKSKRLF